MNKNLRVRLADSAEAKMVKQRAVARTMKSMAKASVSGRRNLTPIAAVMPVASGARASLIYQRHFSPNRIRRCMN